MPTQRPIASGHRSSDGGAMVVAGVGGGSGEGNSGNRSTGHGRGASSSKGIAGGGGNDGANSHLPNYQLGEVLGKGAFGLVFRALNWTTGEVVAVKQISLANIPKSELPEIMSEIELLKNLDHPNIVHYISSVKTSTHLYIILEYCENGSLHTITKKFGKFPETLVSTYVAQILLGLSYLHEQGVIHRDVKGSNILATKEGNIKLADFGVATRVVGKGGERDSSVVGSPYWMAPEVVDQSGATTASDIWSVGCVVIELLEGKPPYHYLDPMPALFRIVNDEYPPLPDGCSSGCRDFLMQCFQKDANLRVGAKKLLRHPWVEKARKGVETRRRERERLMMGKRMAMGSGGGGLGPEEEADGAGQRGVRVGEDGMLEVGGGVGYDETVQRVQEWNRALDSLSNAHKPIPHGPHRVKPLNPPPAGGVAALSPETTSNLAASLGRPASPRRQAPHLTHGGSQRIPRRPSVELAHLLHGGPAHPASGGTASPSLVPLSSSPLSGNNHHPSSAGGSGAPVGRKNRNLNSVSSSAFNANSNSGRFLVAAGPSAGPGLPVTPTRKRTMGSGAGANTQVNGSGSVSDGAHGQNNHHHHHGQSQQQSQAVMNNLKPTPVIEAEEEEDNWDDDFEEGISMSKIEALEREPSASPSPSPAGTPTSEAPSAPQAGQPTRPTSRKKDTLGALRALGEDDSDNYNSATIRPLGGASPLSPTDANFSDSPTESSKNDSKKGKKALPPVLEDYSDLVADDEKEFEGRVASLKLQHSAKRGILHPRDISTSSLSKIATPGVPRTFTRPAVSSVFSRPESPLSSATRAALDSSPTPDGKENGILTSTPPLPPTASGRDSPVPLLPGSGRESPATMSGTGSPTPRHNSMEKYQEGDDDDYSDVFGKGIEPEGESSSQSLKLNTRLSSRSWLGEGDSDEDDPFAEVDEDGFDDADLETNVARDKTARICTFVGELVDVIGTDVDEFELREACLQMIEILEDETEVEVVRTQFIKSHGMLTVIETLQTTQSRDILSLLLRIVNIIVGSDPETLEKLCLVGGCPVMMAFASERYPREIRLEAALFIGSMCRTSLLTLQMFISCRGLKVLVEMMDENYDERRDLIWMAVDGISRVFDMQGPTPRNDFCRMFASEGLLEPLSSTLIRTCQDDDDLAESAKIKIIQIFLIFAQSDMKVKEAVAIRSVIVRLVQALDAVELELLGPLLKTIKNIAMIPKGLDVLQQANAIEVLVRKLHEELDGKYGTEISNHAVNALYNLCRLSKTRQEEAAMAGAVPILQRVAQGASPLKQFALPILCDFAHTSKATRKLLWANNGFKLYLNMLKDPYWSVSALEAILTWLQDETARVEDALLQPESLEALLRMFARSKATAFENLLEPFHKILRTSAAVSTALAGQPAFFRKLVERLSSHSKAVVRLNLLRIVKTICEADPNRHKIAKLPGLQSVVQKLSDSDPAVLVRELAKELVKDFAAARRMAIERMNSKGATRVRPKSLNRSVSAGKIEGHPTAPPTPTLMSSRTPSAMQPRSGNMFGRA